MHPAVQVVYDRKEYVLSGNETDDEVEALVKRGLTPVIVKQYVVAYGSGKPEQTISPLAARLL